jgi:hypothetical protein
MDAQFALLVQRMQTWTLYHWSAIVFGIGLATVLGKALYEELRDNKSIIGRFFILCTTVAVVLFGVAIYLQLAAANDWHFF